MSSSAPTTVQQCQARVERGARVLDEYLSDTDWRQQIDLQRLNINSMQDCILAQLWGSDYDNGARALGITYEEAVVLGFAPGDGHQGLEMAPVLTEAWCEYLRVDKPKTLDDIRHPNSRATEFGFAGAPIGTVTRYDMGHWERGVMAQALDMLADVTEGKQPHTACLDPDGIRLIRAWAQIVGSTDGNVALTITEEC